MRTKQRKTLPKQSLLGAVIPQYVRCGRPTCPCLHGTLHGPYYYRFWREDGRLRKQYVRLAEVTSVRAACDEHRDTRRLFREFRDIGRREWSRLADLLKEADDG